MTVFFDYWFIHDTNSSPLSKFISPTCLIKRTSCYFFSNMSFSDIKKNLHRYRNFWNKEKEFNFNCICRMKIKPIFFCFSVSKLSVVTQYINVLLFHRINLFQNHHYHIIIYWKRKKNLIRFYWKRREKNATNNNNNNNEKKRSNWKHLIKFYRSLLQQLVFRLLSRIINSLLIESTALFSQSNNLNKIQYKKKKTVFLRPFKIIFLFKQPNNLFSITIKSITWF